MEKNKVHHVKRKKKKKKLKQKIKNNKILKKELNHNIQ